MKKIKFAFAIAAGLIVGLSSFTGPQADTTVYGVDPNGIEHAVLLSQEGISWACQSGTKYCTYSDVSLQHPREAQQIYKFVILNP